MNNEQKIVLLAFLIMFFLIPLYGLSHSLSTYSTTTRLSSGLVLILEIILILLSYILFNVFSKKPFQHLKKLFLPISVSITVIIVVIFLIATSQSSSQTNTDSLAPTPTVDQNFIAPSYFSILNGTNNDGEPVGKDYYGNDVFKFVIKNDSNYLAKNIVIKFEFFKTQYGAVQDTKYVTFPQSIAPGDTVTQNVSLYTAFDTVDQYWWKATIMGATKD